MYKTEYDVVVDKIAGYEDQSEITFDKFRDDVLSAYGLQDHVKAQKLFLKSWRNTKGLRNALNMFDDFVEFVRE